MLGGLGTLMRAAGVTEQGDIDCIVAVTAGLTDAQISNDPRGNRWLRHLNRPEARRLAGDEFQRFAELTAALTPDEWATPTDCTAWDVRNIGPHVLGSAEAQASAGEFAHQLRRGCR